MATTESKIPRIIEQYESEILSEWMRNLLRNIGDSAAGVITESDLRLTGRLSSSTCSGERFRRGDMERRRQQPSGQPAREMLGNLSRNRGMQGFTPSGDRDRSCSHSSARS